MMQRRQMVEAILARLDSADINEQWHGAREGTTTRFAVIDDLLPPSVADEIYAAFPRDADGFTTLKSFREHKRTSIELDRYPPILADIIYAMQDAEVVTRIGELTGMADLEGDPRIYASGLSMMFKSQFLNPHLDNSHDGQRGRYRRINLLYYVTPDWALENGGNLELWDEDVTTPVTILSRFNRLVLMETGRTTWHSVSPVAVDRARCCVSNYYFSEASPDGDNYYHVTSFTGRPGQTVRRAVGLVDNGLRQFARKRLGLSKSADAGYVAGEETLKAD